MERVTIKLWEIAWALWEDRNESKHRKENLQTTADLQQLDRTISHLYNSLYGTLPDGDSYLFATPLKELLQKSWAFKKEWTHHASLAKSLQRERLRQPTPQMAHQRMMRQMQGTMIRWLTPRAINATSTEH